MSERTTAALGLQRKFPGYPLALVISHSCDVVNDDLKREPEIEVVAVRVVNPANPDYTNAKNIRVLHLSALKAGNPVFLEAITQNKVQLSKTKLLPFAPDEAFQLESPQLRVLQDWLAGRYKRAAFPDNLNDLLTKKLEKTLEKIGKNNPAAILDIYIEFEPEEAALDAGERYELWINVVYSTDVAGAKETAQDAVDRISKRFAGQFKKEGVWKELELVQCVAVSEAEFTYREMIRMKRYRLDYISLKESLPVDPSDE